MTKPLIVDHELAAGSTISQRLRSLGVTGRFLKPLEYSMVLIWGFGGTGKTYMFQDDPRCYILNFDGKGIEHPNARAIVFPAYDPERARLIDAGGEPIVPQWTHFVEKVKILEQLARDNDPNRPTTVIIDTIDSAVRIAREHSTYVYGVRDGIPTKSVEELGQAAYKYGNEQVAKLINHLHLTCGYGVVIVAHLRNVDITEGGKVKERKIDKSVTTGLLSPFWPQAELSVRAKATPSTKEIVQTITLPDGRTTTRKVQQPHTVFSLAMSDTDVPELCRTKVPAVSKALRNFEVPQSGGWKILCDEYNRTINSLGSAESQENT